MRSLLQTCICISVMLFTFIGATPVERVFVPEKHFLHLTCDGQSDVEWSHGDKRIIRVNSTKFQLLSDGKLLIRDLDDEDSGLYYCNKQLAADVTVFSLMQDGDDYQEKSIIGSKVEVSEGGTLYLGCKPLKQRWAFKATLKSKREYISTRFKNGTVVKERADPDCRFIHTSDHLQIINLQLDDSGIYYCSGREVAAVTVTPAEIHQGTLLTPTAEATESGNNGPQISGNAMLVGILALSVLAVVTVVLVSVIVCLRISSRKKAGAAPKAERTELRPQKRPADEPVTCRREEDHIHYASLGKQNWRSRGWTQESKQQVIYSTLLLTPKHTPSHTPTHKLYTPRM